MSILPYSFCRDDTEKKTLRHGFLLGMMTAVVLLVPFLFVGGIILINAARSPAPPVSEDVMIPYSVVTQPENNESSVKDQVIQAVPIGEAQIAQRAVPQVSVAAQIPLPSAVGVSPVVQQATAITEQYPLPAASPPPEAADDAAESSVLTEGITFSDRRIAYFGGQDVPTAQTGR